MAPQQPAVVMIARHGMRLDAADPSWHLSTPAPYDPPLTYGGWNQCRLLGKRIASLLHARENEALRAPDERDDSVRSHDFAPLNHEKNAERRESQVDGERPRKRIRIKHKVVIHSSPFLRCLQTSMAIAAGMGQYNPTIEAGGKTRLAANKMHSASPRLHATECRGSPNLAPICEPQDDMKHAIAKKALYEHRRYRKSKLRVDAFLGEWLNPEYYEDIMPPPPSAMMVTTAKAELMENEPVQIFTSAAAQQQKSSGPSSLWSGTSESTTVSKSGSLDDWSPVEDALPPSPTSPASRRERASTQSSAGTNDGRKSPFRPGAALQPLASTLPKQETSVYHPPQPQYAISPSDPIPRGYVAHARNACADVDYQWDSSRPPQDWGDGGEFGEEWSSMHKRFRRGLNHLIHWYSRHSADDRSEDALGFEQAEGHASASGGEVEEEQEDVVVIMVTHGAGCNALVGALTGQPVLLDVGMASLTMAARKNDAPPISTYASSTAPGPRYSPTPDQMILNGNARRASLDMGLSSVYDMKLVASSEHLRPVGVPSPSMRPIDSRDVLAAKYRQTFGSPSDSPRSNTSSALGSIRRPLNAITAAGTNGGVERSTSMPPSARLQVPSTPPLSSGLWTPPMANTPNLQPQQTIAGRPSLFSSLSDYTAAQMENPGDDMVLDFSNSPPDSRPGTSSGKKDPSPLATAVSTPPESTNGEHTDGAQEEGLGSKDGDVVPELPTPEDKVPQSLSRGLSQEGLWGSKPSGSKVARRGRETPKRRWTVDQE